MIKKPVFNTEVTFVRKRDPLRITYMVCVLLAVLLMALPIGLHNSYYASVDGEWQDVALPDVSYFDVLIFNPPMLFASYSTVIILILTLMWGLESESVIKSSILTLLSVFAAASSIYVFEFANKTDITIWSYFISALLVLCAGCRIWMLIRLLVSNFHSKTKNG